MSKASFVMIARHLARKFSLHLPVVDAALLLSKSPKMVDECRKAVDCMHKTGVMVLRDSRVDDSENEEFLDMMERYYEMSSQKYYRDGSLPDSRPSAGYNVGILPELKERARPHDKTIEDHFRDTPPVTPQPPPKDKKWRFMWRVGSQAEMTGNNILAENVVPEGMPGFANKMDSFGSILRESCYTASEMIAVGLGVPQNTFRGKMEGGTQLLGPTGSDLAKYNKVGEVLAGFHYDLSFLTIHGKSRFPGLFIWLRTGEKVAVKVPKGCFLLQAAKQLEIMTAGHIFAGFHEVIVTGETLKAIEKAKQEKRSLWRVSSTMFSSIRYDETLKPLDIFKSSVGSFDVA